MSAHTEKRHSALPLFLVPFPVNQHGYVCYSFLFPVSSFHILPLSARKTLYFFHPFLCADLAVHYMTQTLLPFTFLNSTFSSSPLIHSFLQKMFSDVKRLYFLRKFSFRCLPCPSQLHAAVPVLTEKLISNIYKL
jgi:hypothetical protein